MGIADEWHVTCRDAAGKRQGVSITTDGGSVVVVTPPGETAVLSPLEVGRLRAALRDAAVWAAAGT